MNYPYTPLNGDALDSGGLNRDVYKPDTPGASLFDTVNGRIEWENLAPGFLVRSRMIQPWKVGQIKQEGSARAGDYFQDAWGQAAVWYGVAAGYVKFYQVTDASLAWMYASLFAVPWRSRGQESPPGTWANPPHIRVRAVLDGSAIDHSTRTFPESVFYTDTKNYGFGYDYCFSRVERLTRWFQLMHQVHTLSRGWHTFGLEIYVAGNVGSEDLDLDGNIPSALYPRKNALRLYVRNAQVISFL